MNETPSVASTDVIEDQRRGERHEVDLRCDVVTHYDDDTRRLRARDLSPTGMWVETPLPLHPGAEVVVGFAPPTWKGEELMLFARVRRANTGRRRRDRGAIGMGLEFSDLTAEQKKKLADCLESQPVVASRQSVPGAHLWA